MNLVDSDDDLGEQTEEEVVNGGLKKVRIRFTAVHEEYTRFNELLPGGKKVEKSQCKHCNKNYIGKNPTTLIKHLEIKHSARAAEVKKKDDEQRLEKQEMNLLTASQSSTNLQSAVSALFDRKGKDERTEKLQNQNKINGRCNGEMYRIY